ncbi:MAG: HAD-IB family phosphatase [Alphaproteobacteria bacterium]|nr:HAD-IB family phosphatase [Alphaproteobacteria bacterium]
MSRLIVFDVDSTLLAVESLDFAVDRALRDAGDGPQRAAKLKALTDLGMAGSLEFRASLEQRLAIAGLTRRAVDEACEALRAHATEGMADLLEALRAKGHDVAAVSGGFVELISPALADLGFSSGDIRANRFVFDGEAVTGFDRNNPLSRSGGKGQVVAALKALTGRPLAVMVGDGMTDYEAFASGAADSFIGFGAVTVRAPVREKAPAFAETVEDLRKLLLG